MKPLPRLLPFYCALYYAFVLTDGSFNLFAPQFVGLSFNSMLQHMLAGSVDVDPAVIGYEGFARDGRVYAYFGPFCALLRLPLNLTALEKKLGVNIATPSRAKLTVSSVLKSARLIERRSDPTRVYWRTNDSTMNDPKGRGEAREHPDDGAGATLIRASTIRHP